MQAPPTTPISHPGHGPSLVDGWLLSGGQGRRMGGQDKGLVPMADGRPMAWHAARRIAPQVRSLTLNVNRHGEQYAALGWPYLPDDADLPAGFGPLVGMLTGLRHTQADWVQFAPCDYPHLPADMVSTLLAQALHHNTRVAVPVSTRDGETWHHWTCALVHRTTLTSLSECVNAGQPRVRLWLTAQPWIGVCFEDAHAFQNINTLGDL